MCEREIVAAKAPARATNDGEGGKAMGGKPWIVVSSLALLAVVLLALGIWAPNTLLLGAAGAAVLMLGVAAWRYWGPQSPAAVVKQALSGLAGDNPADQDRAHDALTGDYPREAIPPLRELGRSTREEHFRDRCVDALMEIADRTDLPADVRSEAIDAVFDADKSRGAVSAQAARFLDDTDEAVANEAIRVFVTHTWSGNGLRDVLNSSSASNAQAVRAALATVLQEPARRNRHPLMNVPEPSAPRQYKADVATICRAMKQYWHNRDPAHYADRRLSDEAFVEAFCYLEGQKSLSPDGLRVVRSAREHFERQARWQTGWRGRICDLKRRAKRGVS